MKIDHMQMRLQEICDRVVLLEIDVLEVVTCCAHDAKCQLKS